MAISKTETYLVLNYTPNWVSLPTRHESFLLPPGSKNAPSSLPLSIDEIQQANNLTSAFKNRILCFEPEYEEEIQECLRNRNWKNIMTDDEIENLLKNPSPEELQAIVDIEDPKYFKRIYAVFIAMKNANYPIPQDVNIALKKRFSEFLAGKRRTAISLIPAEDKENKDVLLLKKQNESLQSQLDMLKSLVSNLTAAGINVSEITDPKKEQESAVLDTSIKPTQKRNSKKTAKNAIEAKTE